ncbi:hypothetical protein JCM1840_000506 [Sporobolomyces johnsonii]
MASNIPVNSAPPPPPPRVSASSSVAPAPPDSTGSVPSRQRSTHRHTPSTAQWNDLPEFVEGGLSEGGLSRKRTTSTRVSRVPALASTSASSSGLATPTAVPPPAVARTNSDEFALPAFNAPPPPPPEPTLSLRTGQRQLPYDLLHFPGPGINLKLVLVFVPGNPGLVEYYRPFLTSLQAALPDDLKDSTELYAVGQLGHSPAAEREGRMKGFRPNEQASLEEQVESKREFVEELREKYGEEVKIMLMGHSIGAWISLQVLKQRPTLVSSVHCLFPTVSHMATTPNGRRLSPLFSSWALRPVFYSTSMLSYLPTSLTSKLVSLLTGQSGPGSSTTTELVSSPQTVIAALTMAKKELEQIKDLDEELLREHGAKVWWYWAEDGNDGWVSESAIGEIERVLGDEGRERRERCREGMPHAFVLDPDHSSSLARKCANWVVQDLRSSISS